MTYPYFRASNRDLIALFRLLGRGVLRIGGGSVDQVMFSEAASTSHTRVTPAQITALAGFLHQTGWQCIYGINLATSTAALASQEAAHVVSALGSSLLGIEIGNEPDEYSLSGYYFVGNWNFADFIARWEIFRAAILQVAPNAPITGPATGGANHISTWTIPFGGVTTAAQVTLLTQHYYRASSKNPDATAAFLISPDPQLSSYLQVLNAGALALGIPYRLSECNSFYAGGVPGVSNSYASALWVIDFLFTAALNQAAGINMHGGGNQPGYTPIADDSGGVIEARPEYYGMLFFTLAGLGTLLQTHLEGASAYTTAYAVRNDTGVLNVMIVNKSIGSGFTLQVRTQGQIQSASQQILSGPGLSALSGILIQGSPITKNGEFAPSPPASLNFSGDQTSCYIPPLSAVLISIT